MRTKWIAVLLAVAFLCTGCNPATVELKQRLIVQAIGVDYTSENYSVTLQVFDPEGGGNQGAFDASKLNNQVYQAEGRTMMDAFRQISLETGKTVFLGNNQLIVLGETAAREELEGVIGFFSGSHETRPHTLLLACEGEAKEVVAMQLEQGIVPANAIEQMISLAEKAGFCPRSTLTEVVRAVNSRGETPLLAYVGKQTDGSGKMYPGILGACALLDGSPVIQMTQMETRGVQWVRGKVEQTTLLLEDGDKRYSTVLQPTYHRLRPRLEEGRPVFTLRLDLTCSVPEVIHGEKNMDIEQSERLNDLVRMEIEQEVNLALQKALENPSADVFQFAKYLDKYLPEYWKENRENWPLSMPDVKMEFDIRVRLKSLGLSAKNRT